MGGHRRLIRRVRPLVQAVFCPTLLVELPVLFFQQIPNFGQQRFGRRRRRRLIGVFTQNSEEKVERNTHHHEIDDGLHNGPPTDGHTGKCKHRFGKVEAAEQGADQGRKEFFHQSADDAVERTADDDADGQGKCVAAQKECFETFEHNTEEFEKRMFCRQRGRLPFVCVKEQKWLRLALGFLRVLTGCKRRIFFTAEARRHEGIREPFAPPQ